MQEFVEIANTLADESRKIIMGYYRRVSEVDSKADETPVTVADREVEQRLREIIEDKRPRDGIIGEEFGYKMSESGMTWILDPIDGTKSFVIGRPTFGTLVALAEDEIPVLGLIDQAVTKERWIGVKGEQTTLNGEPCHVSACDNIAQANAASTTPDMFDPDYAFVRASLQRQTKVLAWGGDCYAYGLLASGHVDLIVEADLSNYDFAALVPIVEGAGGLMRDWKGKELSIQSDGKVIAASGSSLMSEMLRLVA